MGNCHGKEDTDEGAHDLAGDQDAKPALEKSPVGKPKLVAPGVPYIQSERLKEAQKVVPAPESVECVHSGQIPTPPIVEARVFTLQELSTACDDFSEECLIGEGGFGRVYKGQIANGQSVAIKQLNKDGLQGNREFIVEVLMLSLLHHDNLVNLLGYCSEGDQRLLVYEYMPLGSLEDHLHDLPYGREPLDWPTRLKIAAGAARGLEYLHVTANPPVIYRDLKASNILLGNDFHPKLSDFGLAKLGPVGDKSHVSTRVMGTYGYCAPEYAMTGQLTIKSDVYSFGVVLLELITGRKAIDQSRPSKEHNLVAWARPLFKDKTKYSQMVDPNLRGHFPMRGVFQALSVAAMCIHEQAASRPSIADVVTALNFLALQYSEAPKKVVLAPLHTESEEFKTARTSNGRDSDHEQEGAIPKIFAGSHKEDESCVDVSDVRDTEMHNKCINDSWQTQNRIKAREQAVAEARQWGEALREKRSKGDF
ncbi:hypothetical protein KP509_37G047900 [Ceratopteris richardii]|uniref:non-specific serine/threonine protein kinase n=2 Tax=Ceratopteris richardii TaxID=49495 RepID=A0A8T2Q8D7_CERRI|nr:hypothetical protein KP509_37G047900 [Ceratopteris richardii]